ncbi:Hypothetical predicted protein [Octopus vulgaris]|uniref:Uncharacterized protein n=1 Tax=Octopus vulgaris TaxID=6645 RepID=A0AA36AIN4_OCTVU|nr:Hypothetical predicted protein [Octopus vulgaris]
MDGIKDCDKNILAYLIFNILTSKYFSVLESNAMVSLRQFLRRKVICLYRYHIDVVVVAAAHSLIIGSVFYIFSGYKSLVHFKSNL